MKPSIRKPMTRHLPIIILILLNLMIGSLVVRDYGESWDEPGIYAYADESLQAYSNLFKTGTRINNENTNVEKRLPINADNYGPAYAMITVLLAQGLHAILPDWSLINGWHLGEFLTFQISILSLYFLAKKWMGAWAAMGATLLFSTQPLLWGHAFINPKDIPFLGFFLASVTVGIYMVDALSVPINQAHPPQSEGGSSQRLRDEWGQLPALTKKISVALIVIYLVFIYFMITGVNRQLVNAVITFLYNTDKTSRLGSWFFRHALQASVVPVANYVHKAQLILLHWEIIYVIAGLVIGLLLFPWIFPRYFRKLVRQSVLTLHLFINPGVFAAGCVLGFTTSIRVAGPYAGILVLVYAFYKSWRKAVLLIIPYTAIAVLTSYLTWPYLWPDPVNHFLVSVTLMSHYPWLALVLFQGMLSYPANLPGYYLPYLMTIQLTEVVPALFLSGWVLSAWLLIKKHQVVPFFLTLLWFILPLLGIIINKSTFYNNFRQELFLLPPVFISAGIALEFLFSKLKGTLFRVLLLGALIFPGVCADVQLHPYQYIYYNSFVGGMKGAFRNFELDYLVTSYAEAARYINQVAPVDATVVIDVPLSIAKDYTRPDLKLVSLGDMKPDIHYDFIVLTNEYNKDVTVCNSIRPAKTIAREGAILTVVKTPPLSVAGCP